MTLDMSTQVFEHRTARFKLALFRGLDRWFMPFMSPAKQAIEFTVSTR
jgi:hypothetical protein